MNRERLIAVARGEKPADLLLQNAKVVDVVAGETYEADVAVAEGMIAGVGEGYRGKEAVDLRGRYLCPGYVNAHVHVESSQILPSQYARAVVPRGVTTVVSNPHEIANVVGIEGIRFMLRDALRAPLDQLFTIPSSVPATSLATSGARITAEDMELLRNEPGLAGLGEVMDYPAVVAGDRRVMEEIIRCGGMPIDGHCPGLTGKALNAYAAAGITSEHECTTVEEAREKLQRGMKIFIREGSVARNLSALLPLITPANERWLSFCTDDSRLLDLVREGSIDHLLRMAIAGGIPPMTAIRMATLNPAEHFQLFDRGVIAPGRRADLVVFSELDNPTAEVVFCRGNASRSGETAAAPKAARGELDALVRDTMHVDLSRVDFRIRAEGRQMRVIGTIPHQLITENLLMEPLVKDGYAVPDPHRDLLKMVVIERHVNSGRIGKGFVTGMGLKRGAIAGTVAHDHHNLVVIGADDISMRAAAEAVVRVGGGQAVAEGEKIRALLPLPIAGLMSDRTVEEVCKEVTALADAVETLGAPVADPLMTMSFLGLEVIPALKLTDFGLIDVNMQKVVPLFV